MSTGQQRARQRESEMSFINKKKLRPHEESSPKIYM